MDKPLKNTIPQPPANSFPAHEDQPISSNPDNSDYQENSLLQVSELFSGPLPHPEILKNYEKVLKGSANRIISMAENEAAHRHELENRLSKSESRDSLLGIIFALIIAVVIMLCGTIIAVKVPSIAGVIAGTVLDLAGIGSIVGIFIRGTRPTNNDENPRK